MKKIILSGCNGRMGQVLQRSIKANPELTVVAGIDHVPSENPDFPVYGTPDEVVESADVIIINKRNCGNYSAQTAVSVNRYHRGAGAGRACGCNKMRKL